MNRRTLTQSLLAATATGIALPGALRAQTPSASPATSSGSIRLAEVPGTSVALSPDGTMIGGIGDDDRFHVWDAASFETIARSEPAPEIGLIDQRSVTWSPDSTALAWSLDATRLFRDSAIYVFDIDTGQTANLTDDPMDENAARNLLGEHSGPPMDVDLYPSWSADGANLFFARTVWDDAPELPTSLWRIPREGGGASEVALLAPDEPFLVNSIHAGMEDGSLLYSTWPIDPDSHHHGVFIITPDGEVEGISTGMLSRDVPMMQIISVAPAARKASVVSLQNLARLDGDSPIWVELDLDTGIPTPFEDVLPLTNGESGDADPLLAAPAFLTDSHDGTGALTGYLYATADGGYDTFTLWRHDVMSGETVELGRIENVGRRATGVARVPSVQVASNGIAALSFAGNIWLVPIDG